MADGFSAIPSVLSAGSRQLRELQNDVDRAGSQAAGALIGAAEACGNGQVQGVRAATRTRSIATRPS